MGVKCSLSVHSLSLVSFPDPQYSAHTAKGGLGCLYRTGGLGNETSSSLAVHRTITIIILIYHKVSPAIKPSLETKIPNYYVKDFNYFLFFTVFTKETRRCHV